MSNITAPHCYVTAEARDSDFLLRGAKGGGYLGRGVVFRLVGVRESVEVLWLLGRIVVVEVYWLAWCHGEERVDRC